MSFIHMPEILHDFQDIVERVEFYTHRNMFLKNVWHEFWDRIENVGFYTHPRRMFPSQQMFSTNIRRELKMLGFMHILEICFHPQMFGTNFGRELKMLGFVHILDICFHTTNVWNEY